MSEDAKTDADDGSDARSRTPLFVGLAIAAVLFALAWLFLPAWDFLVQPVAPAVRDEIAGAIEATTDPAEQARLRLELAALEQEDAARRSGLRNGVATLLAGGVAAWGAVSAWRQLQQNREEAEDARRETNEQLQLARDELSLARHGQITQRFARAVEQLGNDRTDVRIGGIYLLERIARDSETDRQAVIDQLSAFVRDQSRGRSLSATDSRIDFDLLFKIAIDVQTALSALGRIVRVPKPLYGGPRLNLAASQIPGVYLWAARFPGAVLAQSDLRCARLIGGADLRNADLVGADFRNADLRGANLGPLPDGTGAGAYLTDADLRGADLTEACLAGADLRGANLGPLPGEYGYSADLTDADLSGADLRGAEVVDTLFSGATADAETRWPDGFNPKGEGVTFIHEKRPDAG